MKIAKWSVWIASEFGHWGGFVRFSHCGPQTTAVDTGTSTTWRRCNCSHYQRGETQVSHNRFHVWFQSKCLLVIISHFMIPCLCDSREGNWTNQVSSTNDNGWHQRWKRVQHIFTPREFAFRAHDLMLIVSVSEKMQFLSTRLRLTVWFRMMKLTATEKCL